MDSDDDRGAFTLCPITNLDDEEVTVYRIHNVFTEDLVDEIKSEAYRFPLEQISNDISQFQQSENLDQPDYFNLHPALKKFVLFLKTKLRKTVESRFRLRTRPKLTVTISNYKKGDYLLCHDDRLGTRAVAFVYYLNAMTENDGGTLRFLYSTSATDNDPVVPTVGYKWKVTPRFNTLVLFRVNSTSHHEVEQIFTNSERLTINGWFHYEEPHSSDDLIMVNPVSKSDIVDLTMHTHTILPPSKMISEMFRSKESIQAMKEHYMASEERAIMIRGALQEEFFRNCVLEVVETLPWEAKGPANFRFYETIPFDVEGPHINFGESLFHVSNLLDLLLSPKFLVILTEITGAEYAVFKAQNVPPACMIELQRWKEGHYSLLTDNNIEREMPCIEVTVFFSVNKKIVENANSDKDLSGVIVQSCKYDELPTEVVQNLRSCKQKRLEDSFYILNRRVPRQKRSQVKPKWMTKMNQVVEDKINRIQRYRRSRPAKAFYLTPQDNTMIITYSSEKNMRYTSYIKKRDAVSDPRVAFYALSVTYFLTSGSS